MPALESDLRRQLENVIIQARDVAEGAARSALQKRAVDAAEPFSHFGSKERELRTRLRARGRQVGDVRNDDKTQSIDQLTQELAYEFWHRMLFARFLAENHLLMHPDGVAVSLEECEELAKDADPPAPNGFVLAARYASTMLPEIFRKDDVLLEIDFAPEHRIALEKELSKLPQNTFQADDSLGWVYQFWQSDRKKEINDSEDKIDGYSLPSVTQLFTEHYMVQFLQHNTIGAWWCGRHGIKGPPGGAGIPVGRSPVEMEYLRWSDDGTPAAGNFEGWPKTLAEFKMLDPCCGSGHFLVNGFNLLVPLRMHDERLTAEQACEAVLRENIFGLELDPRCTQIAAFALALAAWKYPNAGGYRSLPTLNVACSGQSVTGKKDEWLALASGNDRLREGMDRLFDLFQQAPHFGSLIDPQREKGNMYEAGYAELQPLMSRALTKHSGDADLTAVGVAAQGIAKAAELLGKHYTLVMTNVPFLGKKGKLCDLVKSYLEEHYSLGKGDLAASFMFRCMELCSKHGTMASVTPQSWLSQSSYKSMRGDFLKKYKWNWLARLGARAFETISGEVVNVALIVVTADMPTEQSELAGVDVSEQKTPAEKSRHLANPSVNHTQFVLQSGQLKNPDMVLTVALLEQSELLSKYASCVQGLATSDDPQFTFAFWEVPTLTTEWVGLMGTVEKTCLYGGREHVLFWENGSGRYYRHAMALKSEGRLGGWKSGTEARGKKGVLVSQMSSMPVTLYDGAFYDHNASVIVPKHDSDLVAIWAFASSDEFYKEVRKLDQSLKPSNNVFVKVPFDHARWHRVAKEQYPNGLPEPHSDDPTQWIFKGDIATSTTPLQAAVARLLAYHWPAQSKTTDAIDNLSDMDGIVCLPGVRGEAAASERLLEVLQAAYGSRWSDSLLHKLLTDAGCKAGTTLEDWLRNQFFEHHCKKFGNRPFIWHIWDGRKDGFSVLVNYHKLDHKALENLTYSYLGDWIKSQSKSDKAGADSRLGAAQELQMKLKLILAGEPPYDIFVRWKPVHEQAIGWHPDLDDGVRMNIRPFIEADILRKSPNIKWTKDRGKEPDRDKGQFPWFWDGSGFIGDRVNDIHLTIEKKTAARNRSMGAK